MRSRRRSGPSDTGSDASSGRTARPLAGSPDLTDLERVAVGPDRRLRQRDVFSPRLPPAADVFRNRSVSPVSAF